MGDSICLALALVLYVLQFASAQTYNATYRPQHHFTSLKNWMNDSHALLYYNGVYHMYYQFNPGETTWGSISWGHATSRDLSHWQEHPVALLAHGYPGTTAEMFLLGSVVADIQNTSGFGVNGTIPFVAIYTSDYLESKNMPSGQSVTRGQQAQSMAYSLDEGMTWITYDIGNPVIPVPPRAYANQYENFRDPFVFWHSSSQKWVAVVSLAHLHKLLFYTSTNLKDWIHVSEFGSMTAIGGMWECPSIFPLLLDGNEANVKWIAQIRHNPGGPLGNTGSGMQYVVGSFDGTNFLADTTASGISVFQSFEDNGTFTDIGWTATKGLIGASLAQGTLPGQQAVTGYQGNRLVNTFLNGDATVGTLTSPSFNIAHKKIHFLIGGGDFPSQECMNLVIQGQVVRTATGSNSEHLLWNSWDVASFIGRNATIEIVDLLSGGWGHIMIDQITFSNSSLAESGTTWVDWGPDFYAATSFDGPSSTGRVQIGWMNNWQYGGVLPRTPWRSNMSIPRTLSLQTINEKATLVQQPKEVWTPVETTGSYVGSWDILPEGSETLQLSGKALDVTLTFHDRSSLASTAQFGIILRATSDLTQQTRVGYDFSTKKLFIDRTKSGDFRFVGTYPSIYYAPLTPFTSGLLSMRILLDCSSVVVFGGKGEVTLTTQIFPNDYGTDVRIFSTGGGTSGVTINAKAVESTWQASTSNWTSTSSSAVVTTTSSAKPTTSGLSTLLYSSSCLSNLSPSENPTSHTPTLSSSRRSSNAASSINAYDFRPTYHFSPEKYWMNEPNGLIKIGSSWHLFFQHNPTGNFWGNMSWGHSTSTDLLHWNYLPVALPVEDNIQCFTGTSWYDNANASGLGTSANPPYLAFYTGYEPSSGVQDQRLAYSLDQGAHYIKLGRNPIISQTQEKPHDITGGLETRDPKVVFYAPTNTWVMVLSHGGQNKMSFWTSTDTKNWTWKSDLKSSDIPGFPGAATGWEVPDLFELPIKGTARTIWILLFTPANGSPAGGNGVVGITGSFDGVVFTANPVDESTLWLDYGRDWDGAMSWENVPASDGRRIIAAIMNSYGANPPTNKWKGMLSFPRKLTLTELNGKLTFLQQPVAELEAISAPLTQITNHNLAPGEKLLSNIYGKALDIRVVFIPTAGSTLSLVIRMGGADQTIIRYIQSSGQLQVDRTSSGNISYDSTAGGIHAADLQPDASGVVRLRVLTDECSVEVFGGEGQVVISDLIFPSETSNGLSLFTTGGNIALQLVEIFSINL